MSPDLETLRALADGELSPQRRAEVEAAVASDPELTAAWHALLASRLPYQCAFAQEPVPAVPAALTARVAELSAVAIASREIAPAGRGREVSSWWASGLTMAQAMTLALLLFAVGLAGGYGAASHRGAARVEPWVMKVASYHSMYGRETVSDGSSGSVQSEVLKQRLRLQGLELRVPDLSARGLQFVRAQQLQFEGKMVLQMVFLPSQGAPVALCLMPALAQPERVVSVDGLHALTWHAGQWAYVLVGSLPLAEMKAIRGDVPDALI